MYKVLITTSGTGSRLGKLVKDTNKSLVEINGKAIIDYIVESYPKYIEIVLTLGYFGEKVKQHVLEQFPDRQFTFFTVDKYEGPGTSLGYSMLQVEHLLQCPFVFNCNDTIPNSPVPSPENYNWDGGSLGQDPAIFNTQKYSSYSVKDGSLTTMNAKGASEYDLFHIGLAGFKDYHEFWKNLRNLYNQNPNDSSLNDCYSMKIMIADGFIFKSVKFPKWLDTGNLDVLEFAKNEINHL